MTVFDATLVNVTVDDLGTGLVADATAGDSVLYVEQTFDLSESGGVVRIMGLDYEYDAVDKDSDPATITLNAGNLLAVDVPEGMPVSVLEDGGVAQKWTAWVDNGSDDDALPVTIGGEWIKHFVPGDEQAGATVAVNDTGRNGPEIAGRPNQDPPFDASNAYNLPDPAAVALDPPDVSPEIVTLQGNAQGILVVTEPILPTTLLDFYVNGVLVAEGQRTTILQLGFEDLAQTDPMDPDTDYNIFVLAQNNAGTAPAPSATKTGRMDPGVTPATVTAILQAGFALLGSIQVGSSMTIDPDGWTITHPDGRQTYFRADGTGNQMVGQAILDAATILGSLTILGLDNFLNGLLTLGTGVGNPTAMPGVTSSGYDFEEFTNSFTGDPHPDEYRRGLHWTGTQWLTATAAPFGYGTSLWDTAADDTFTGAFMPGGFRPIGGAVKISTNYYVLGKDDNRGSDWWVFVFNSSWTKTNEWAPLASPTDSLTLGGDGSTLLVGKRTAVNNLYVLTYSTAGSLSATDPCGTWSGAELTGVHKRAVDTATVRYVIASATAIRVFNTSTGARVTAEEWAPAATPIRGLGYDGTNWFTHDGATIWEYTNLIGTWDFAFTWVDDDAGGTGTAETEASTIRTMPPTKRAKWTLSLPSEPPDDGTTDGANTGALYAAPTGNTLVLQTALAEGTLTETFSTLALVGTAPPGSNGFAGRIGAIGRFASAAADADGPLLDFNGDGSYRLAGQDLDGTNGWVTLASSVTGAWGIQYAVLNGRMTVWVDGLFASTSGTDHTISTGTLPAALLPPVNARAGGYFSGHAGTVSVLTDGTVHAVQQSGAGRASVSGIVTYPLV